MMPGEALGRFAVVLVDEVAEYLPPTDRAAQVAPGVGDRRLLPQCPVRARPVVVCNKVGQDLAQMPLVGDEETIHVLLTHRPDAALRVRIRRRCPIRRAVYRDTLGHEHGIERWRELGVAIVAEAAGRHAHPEAAQDVQGRGATRLDGAAVVGQQLLLVLSAVVAPRRYPPPLRCGRHAVAPEGRARPRG